VHWNGLAAAKSPRCRAILSMACLLACALAGITPRHARADDAEAVKPAPRTAIAIGGASVVLVAANGNLYAFVDRIADNAPVPDAELAINAAGGGTIKPTRAMDGLFVAPFDRAGHMHDAFMVTLRSAVASGDAPAEIAYDDLPDAGPAEDAARFGPRLAIALASASIGAIASALVMLRLRVRRRIGARPVVPVPAA
jgi:hypothetical protein